MRKRFLYLTFVCSVFCFKGIGQNVEVSLKIDPYSPFIAKYSKEQMVKKLLDTVITAGHAQFLELGKDINFYAEGDTSRFDLPTYRLEISVVDTTYISEKRQKELYSVNVHRKFFEREMQADKVKGWNDGLGVSYNLLGGNIEDDAIMVYLGWVKIAAGITLEQSLPLSLTERIESKNILEKDEVSRFVSIRELVVIIDSQNILPSGKEDVEKITRMINNIFFSCQNSFAKRKKGDHTYFNYYITTDPYGHSWKTLYSNPAELKFVLKSIGKDDYQINLEFDENRYSFNGYSGIPLERNSLVVTQEILQKMPSQINHKISEFVNTFIRSNLD